MSTFFSTWLSEEAIQKAEIDQAKREIKKNGTIAGWVAKNLKKEIKKK